MHSIFSQHNVGTTGGTTTIIKYVSQNAGYEVEDSTNGGEGKSDIVWDADVYEMRNLPMLRAVAIGVNTAAEPAEALEVNGSIKLSGSVKKGDYTFTLPASSGTLLINSDLSSFLTATSSSAVMSGTLANAGGTVSIDYSGCGARIDNLGVGIACSSNYGIKSYAKDMWYAAASGAHKIAYFDNMDIYMRDMDAAGAGNYHDMLYIQHLPEGGAMDATYVDAYAITSLCESKSDDTKLMIRHHVVGGSTTSAITIDKNKVGINNDSPAQALDVNGAVVCTTSAVSSSDSATTWTISATDKLNNIIRVQSGHQETDIVLPAEDRFFMVINDTTSRISASGSGGSHAAVPIAANGAALMYRCNGNYYPVHPTPRTIWLHKASADYGAGAGWITLTSTVYDEKQPNGDSVVTQDNYWLVIKRAGWHMFNIKAEGNLSTAGSVTFGIYSRTDGGWHEKNKNYSTDPFEMSNTFYRWYPRGHEVILEYDGLAKTNTVVDLKITWFAP